MSDYFVPNEDRLLDLLADRAVFGLDDDDQTELDRLSSLLPEVDTQCMERAAAAVCLAGVDRLGDPLPASVRLKLQHLSLEGPGNP